MKRIEIAVSSAISAASIEEHLIEGVTQGSLKSHGLESRSYQNEFEKTMKTLRRVEPDALEPPACLITPRPQDPEIVGNGDPCEVLQVHYLICEDGVKPIPVVRKRV